MSLVPIDSPPTTPASCAAGSSPSSTDAPGSNALDAQLPPASRWNVKPAVSATRSGSAASRSPVRSMVNNAEARSLLRVSTEVLDHCTGFPAAVPSNDTFNVPR